jgi:hypothetical protein
MMVAVSAGTQRDNLDKSKISTMRRMVGSINVNYMPSQKLNLSTSYSTFQSYTNIRSQFVDINQLTQYGAQELLASILQVLVLVLLQLQPGIEIVVLQQTAKP